MSLDTCAQLASTLVPLCGGYPNPILGDRGSDERDRRTDTAAPLSAHCPKPFLLADYPVEEMP